MLNPIVINEENSYNTKKKLVAFVHKCKHVPARNSLFLRLFFFFFFFFFLTFFPRFSLMFIFFSFSHILYNILVFFAKTSGR